jgi:ankyrin repeat protein/beta-lactamase regulating signal transducer with metallopeptidase domain
MESWLTRITDYLLTQSWQIAILTIVVAAASFFLRNRSAHVRYLLWLVVLAKCLVPPVYSISLAVLPQREPLASAAAVPLAERGIAENSAPEGAVTEPVRPTFRPTATPPAPQVLEKPATYNIRAWPAVGWLAGALALLAFNLVNALRTQVWLQRQRRTLPVESRREIRSFFSAHGLKRIPSIWLLDGVSQPFVWGLVRGSIYLPLDFADLKDRNRWASLLGHELSHVIRCDAVVNSFQVVAQIVFWFHPFVWWANRRIRTEREKCCDEMTVARLHTPPEDYSEAIVETLAAKHEQVRPVPSLAVAGQIKNIEERIKTMLKPGKKFYKRPSLIVAMAIMLIALLTVPTALVLTARAVAGAAATPLHQAAADRNLKEARSLISRGANINAKDKEGRTPLFYAVENGHTFMCDLLIVKGADVNAKDAAGDTPLHHAARLVTHGDWRLAAELTRRGADVNAMNKQRQTPLHVALEGGNNKHAHVASMLLWYDVNINAEDANGTTVLHLAAQRAIDPEDWGEGVLGRILTKGADANLKDAKGRAALHFACDHDPDAQHIVKMILERAKGVRLDIADSNGVTPLHIAALRGQRNACELLIANGANVDAKDKYGRTPAHHAVRAGNIETANSLIENGADISSIHLSAYKGNLSNLKTLLARGVSVNEQDETGFTALHAAAAGGHREVVEYLISQGGDIEAEGGPGWTALSYAARGNYKDVVEALRAKGIGGGKKVSRLLPVVIERGYVDIATTLIALGADVNFDDGRPLGMAARHGHKDIVELLISKGAAVINPGQEQWWDPLDEAARYGRIDIARYLIEAGADVNGKVSSWSPLGFAAGNGHKRMVEFLLSKGADVNKAGGWGFLHEAIHYNHFDIVKLLLEHGADVNQGGGYSPLGLAAWYVPAFVELLVNNGGDVNAISPKWGWTPLHLAVYGGNRDAFDLLVSRGANVNARTDRKETVLHLLIQWGRKPDQVRFVLSRGVDINAADACGWTALHRAVLYNLPEIVDLLMAEGADVNVKDNDGRTPLWLAKERRQERIVGLLRKHGAEE